MQKAITKNLLSRPAIRAGLSRILAGYIRFVQRTSRWELRGAEAANALWDDGKPFILCFWHGRLMMMPLIWRRGMRIEMLISQHRDGDLIARTIAHFGLDTVRGSKGADKGGSSALRAMLKALASGHAVGITPDGPRGPRMRVSSGIVAVARASGAPILPAVSATSRRVVLNSWDRFLIALPFSRGVLMWGAPIEIARDCDPETARLTIESAMNELAARADEAVGRTAIEPDPVAA